MATKPAHLVISDYNMPGMDGLHLLKALREHNPRIERLVLSDWRNNLGNKTLHMLAPLQELAVLDVHGNACNHEGLTALIEGAGGIFDVIVDGKLIFSKHDVDRFPEHDEVLSQLA